MSYSGTVQCVLFNPYNLDTSQGFSIRGSTETIGIENILESFEEFSIGQVWSFCKNNNNYTINNK